MGNIFYLFFYSILIRMFKHNYYDELAEVEEFNKRSPLGEFRVKERAAKDAEIEKEERAEWNKVKDKYKGKREPLPDTIDPDEEAWLDLKKRYGEKEPEMSRKEERRGYVSREPTDDEIREADRLKGRRSNGIKALSETHHIDVLDAELEKELAKSAKMEEKRVTELEKELRKELGITATD